MRNGIICIVVIFLLFPASALAVPLFDSPLEYSAGGAPVSVCMGDLDGDNDLDLAVANQSYNNVSILLNNGDGTYAAAVHYGAGAEPFTVCMGDLDGDNDLDLAVANRSSNNVSILLNNGDGTYAAAVNYSAGGYPLSVFAGDLDGDNDLDLAVASYYSNDVSILLNNGDGTYTAAVHYGAGSRPVSVCMGDLDGDNDLDLAVANHLSNDASILLNNGDGTYAAAGHYGAGGGPFLVCMGDLDGDNDLDLAVANFFSDNVSVLLNNGDGTYAAAVHYGAGGMPESVCMGDLDGDNDLDLAVANHLSYVSVLLNNGDGTYAAAVNYWAGDAPASCCMGDLDGDNDLDLVVANQSSNNVSVFINLTYTKVGTLAGQVVAECPVAGTPLHEITIDAYEQGTGDLVGTALTDVSGTYMIDSLEASDYTITIMTPLGYKALSEEIPITIVGDDTVVVDFPLTCVDIITNPRSIGFWKHQVGVATGGKGNAHIDASTLCDYLDLIEAHFNNNAINEVVVYQPPLSGDCNDKLAVTKGLLNLKGSVAIVDRAKQQLMALLFNVAAEYIGLMEVISKDGAIVSQAITYCDQLIDDGDGDNDEQAMDIADMINNAKVISEGVVPLDTPNISYARSRGGKRTPNRLYIEQNYPNPFNPSTTISYYLPEECHVTLRIYDAAGRRVVCLMDKRQVRGRHSIVWNGLDGNGRTVGAGIYFLHLRAGKEAISSKMILLR